jgi:hypothetical protein
MEVVSGRSGALSGIAELAYRLWVLAEVLSSDLACVA